MSKFSTYLRHPVARNAATFVQIFCAYHVVGAYLGYPQQTDGPSMLPGLGVRGEWLWVSTLHRRGRWVKVGDLVSVKHPQFPGEGVSKRVLGMPGDFVMRDTPESGSDVMIQVPAGHCWLAGDNVPWSRDSRDYGPVPLALIRGKATARVWPLYRIKRIENTMKDLPG